MAVDAVHVGVRCGGIALGGRRVSDGFWLHHVVARGSAKGVGVHHLEAFKRRHRNNHQVQDRHPENDECGSPKAGIVKVENREPWGLASQLPLVEQAQPDGDEDQPHPEDCWQNEVAEDADVVSGLQTTDLECKRHQK